MTLLLLMSLGCIFMIGIVGISGQLMQGHAYRDRVVRYYEGTHNGVYTDVGTCTLCRHQVHQNEVLVSFPISFTFIHFEHHIELKTQLVRRY